MIRNEAALKLAKDILGDDAPAVNVQMAATLIVRRVKQDELEQQHELREAESQS